MSFEYLGTALFFLWVSFSIFRWLVRTAAEVRDAPPAMTRLEEEILRQAAMRSGSQIRREARTPVGGQAQ
jgi:hypothetical protein